MDLKTSWIIAGLGHGHRALDLDPAAADAAVLERREGHAVANAALPEHMEITPDNVASFHFHGSADERPVTAVLVAPGDRKSAALIQGRYLDPRGPQVLVPATVVDEIVRLVFRIKALFDANAALVAVSSGLFFGVVVSVSVRLRARERDTLFRLGCSSRAIFGLFAYELAMVVGLGLLAAFALAWATSAAAPQALRLWM